MKMLSDDDLDLAAMNAEELEAAWDLWFDLAQATNDDDPPWTHGVFVGLEDPTPTAAADALFAASTRSCTDSAGSRRSGRTSPTTSSSATSSRPTS